MSETRPTTTAAAPPYVALTERYRAHLKESGIVGSGWKEFGKAKAVEKAALPQGEAPAPIVKPSAKPLRKAPPPKKR